MKTLVLACVAWGIGVVGVRADLTVIEKVTGAGQDMEDTQKFKAGKLRVDTSPGTSIIMDRSSGEMINLMHAPKKYIKVPREVAEGLARAQGKSIPAKPLLVATGKTETISSFMTEEYTYNAAETKMTLWLTKALPDYETALREMRGPFGPGTMSLLMQGEGIDLTTLPGFPIRTVLEIQPGQTVTHTVVSVNTQPIADAEFTIPADYQELSVPVLTPPAAVAEPSVPSSR